jgi:hypothetical protein
MSVTEDFNIVVTVNELIAWLKRYDGKAPVIVTIDNAQGACLMIDKPYGRPSFLAIDSKPLGEDTL